MVEQIKALALNPNALHLRKGSRAGSPYSPRNSRSKSRGSSSKRNSCTSASAGLVEGVQSVPGKMQKTQTEFNRVNIEQIDAEAKDVYKVIHGHEVCTEVVPIDSEFE